MEKYYLIAEWIKIVKNDDIIHLFDNVLIDGVQNFIQDYTLKLIFRDVMEGNEGCNIKTKYDKFIKKYSLEKNLTKII